MILHYHIEKKWHKWHQSPYINLQFEISPTVSHVDIHNLLSIFIACSDSKSFNVKELIFHTPILLLREAFWIQVLSNSDLKSCFYYFSFSQSQNKIKKMVLLSLSLPPKKSYLRNAKQNTWENNISLFVAAINWRIKEFAF